MHQLSRLPHVRAGGFVHVPYSPQQAAAHPGAPSMALGMMTEAIRIMIKTSLHTAKDVKVSAGITH